MKTLTFKLDTNNKNYPAAEDPIICAQVTVGQMGGGWMLNFPMVGVENETGMWDLGKGGFVTISSTPSEVTVVAVRYYADRMMYTRGPEITLNGKKPTFEEQTPLDTASGTNVFNGGWVTQTCTWNGLVQEPIIKIASPSTMPFDSIVDNIILQVADVVENQANMYAKEVSKARDTLSKVVVDLEKLLTQVS